MNRDSAADTIRVLADEAAPAELPAVAGALAAALASVLVWFGTPAPVVKENGGGELLDVPTNRASRP